MQTEEFRRQAGIVRGFFNNIDRDIQEARALYDRPIATNERNIILEQLSKRVKENLDEAALAFARLASNTEFSLRG